MSKSLSTDPVVDDSSLQSQTCMEKLMFLCIHISASLILTPQMNLMEKAAVFRSLFRAQKLDHHDHEGDDISLHDL